MRTKLLVALAVAVWLPACGLDDLGVRSVSFGLRAQAVLEPPVGLEDSTLVALMGASGTTSADVLTDDLHIAVSGLPVLPQGFSYVAMGRFAEHSREAIPGGANEADTGHSEGALTGTGTGTFASGELRAEDHALETVILGPLEPGEEPGAWEIELSSSDLTDVELGALRGAMIMLIPDAGAAVMVLAGEVGEDAVVEAGADEGGHSHGP